MKKYVIIVAGGTGSRAGAPIPKQFVEINGRPMLYHTMLRFVQGDSAVQIILVLHPDYIQFWKRYMNSLPVEDRIEYLVAEGGATRTESVRNGLKKVSEDGLVAIHDAARPCFSVEMLESGWKCAAECGTAIPVVQITDSLRLVDALGRNRAVDRRMYRAVQTPQIFDVQLIKRAYASMKKDGVYTDDASVVEDAGVEVAIYEGDVANIKVTTAEDFAVAALRL